MILRLGVRQVVGKSKKNMHCGKPSLNWTVTDPLLLPLEPSNESFPVIFEGRPSASMKKL